MKLARRLANGSLLLFTAFALAWACGWDSSLREYLDAHFWLPFSKEARHFERKNVRRVSAPYAGMIKAEGDSPISRLRAAYQEMAVPMDYTFDPVEQLRAVAAARADASLTPREREEVDLIEAKIEMRSGQPGAPQPLLNAKEKLQRFLKTARTPEFLSEARGWLAHIHYLLGERTAAGKIYLDELNRDGSNLSRETLLNSLRMTYGYDGGPELLVNLEEYFDTPEHAAFAIQLATNPRWDRYERRYERPNARIDQAAQSYARITALLEKHSHLLDAQAGSASLVLLSMRTALRMGDSAGALRIAVKVPDGSSARQEPDFSWMLASARYLSHEYAAAEAPLLTLFRSPASSENQRAAAAYGLCGVYEKTGDRVEQIRYALWLRAGMPKQYLDLSHNSSIADQSVYWAPSGWDLNLLLDAEASIEALRAFLEQYPNVADVRLVRYALAVRLTREEQYEEAARIYEAIHAVRRAPRLRQLAALQRESTRTDLPAQRVLEARYRLAEFITAHPEGIYFNDALWSGFQRYALYASTDSRLTRQERQTLMDAERKLKDDQEERWRAYLILQDVVRQSGKTELGGQAAQLAIRCLRGINTDRFGREGEIRQGDIEMSKWLAR